MNDTVGVLLRPFPPDKIKERPGQGGRALSYIEGHEVVYRLIEAFALTWSFRVLSHEIGNHQVIVLGELRAGDTVKQAFGGSDITRSRDGGQSISVADDLKAAATDALKKCATLFGVGLHLYGDGQSNRVNGHDTSRNGRGPSNGSGGLSLNGHGHDGRSPVAVGGGEGGVAGGRLSRKQLSFIHRLGQQRGMHRGDLDEMSRAMFGRTSAYLDGRQASQFIDELKAGVQ